ncbi:OmpA family protein [Piscinibacter sp.]|uniref:OmpA family protein n=1 Tax=Piscinibacter sp. TaxID=1903157 RepID=UPI0025DFAA63|nr:OmpA family protein [Piscinibacter sp.]
MREFHPKVWAVRWLMAGVVMALLGCQSAPPPTLDARAQKVAALRKLGFTHAADAWELKLGVKLLFESNADEVSEEGRAALAEVAHTLTSVGVDRVIVEGHTDNVGSAKFNEALSLRRAESVAQHLMQAGMNAAGIERRGLGFDKPIADNATPEGRAQNRRVVVTVRAD